MFILKFKDVKTLYNIECKNNRFSYFAYKKHYLMGPKQQLFRRKKKNLYVSPELTLKGYNNAF